MYPPAEKSWFQREFFPPPVSRPHRQTQGQAAKHVHFDLQLQDQARDPETLKKSPAGGADNSGKPIRGPNRPIGGARAHVPHPAPEANPEHSTSRSFPRLIHVYDGPINRALEAVAKAEKAAEEADRAKREARAVIVRQHTLLLQQKVDLLNKTEKHKKEMVQSEKALRKEIKAVRKLQSP